MTSTVILIERAMDVSRALHRGERDATWVSLSPDASLELDRQKLPYRILEEWTPAEEFNREALARYAWLDEFVLDLDQKVQMAIPLMKSLEAQPAKFYYRYFKIYFDCMASKVQLLTNAF